MLAPFSCLYRNRRLLASTTLNAIRSRYTGTAFGTLWLVLFPLLFLAVYGTVFAFVLKVRLAHQTTFEYIMMVFAGLIPFLAFSEMLGATTNSVITNRSLIKNTLFPLELIPAQEVFTTTFRMLISFGLLLGVLWFNGIISWRQILIVPVIALQVLFSCGLAWIFGAVAVGFRDLSQLIGILNLILMLASPIGYTKDMIPPKMMLFMYLNPLYYLIMLYRGLLFENTVLWTELGIFSLISFVMFYLGHHLFVRLKGAMLEYV
ncbi:MAG: ABC transporter permease [Desulfovibrionaceae bacterium]|nr:ABC transporter permease [Desulfovibrionaceae bacterium]